MDPKNQMIRVGVFYDGNYFLHVSNYYAYQHERSARISIRGLHEFIREQVSRKEGVSPHLCPVVDAHYFRGRQSAYDAQENNRLYAERQFDDILMNEGVTTHYLPIRTRNKQRVEKGVDVWLALEAFEHAVHRKYDVLVLIASDGDYVPLVRKVQALGVKVMLLSWDMEYTDDAGNPRETRTSQDLLEEVIHPIPMHEIIDNRLSKNDMLVNNLFLPSNPNRSREHRGQQPREYEEHAPTRERVMPLEENGEVLESTIFDVLSGYGFIHHPPNNLFFHFSDLVDTDFSELQKGDVVEYTVGHNDRGPCARNVRLIREGGSTVLASHDDDYEEDDEYNS